MSWDSVCTNWDIAAQPERIRITQLDGKLPNLALMKLSHFHRNLGDDVFFTRNARNEENGIYDRVYGSAIFTRSIPLTQRLLEDFPNAILGGTGVEEYRQGTYPTVESFLDVDSYEFYDYIAYPDFTGSIGFTQRGCRLACPFCIVPKKEGKPKSTSTISEIYRGEPYPRHIHLLDNDFFGQPEDQWKARLQEVIDGDFKICFNQGINVRMITPEIASWLTRVKCYDDQFTKRTIYTAWDNLGDEERFIRGIKLLLDAGFKGQHIFVYMLIGYDAKETWERIFHRFNRMLELRLKPYPMVYDKHLRTQKTLALGRFQRWVIGQYYHIIPWHDFVMSYESDVGCPLEFDAEGDYIEHIRGLRKLSLGRRALQKI